MAQQAPMGGLAALGLSGRELLDREMSYDGSHPRQQEQAARDHFRSYGPNMLMDALIPGYGAGGDAAAASEAFGEGRYGAAALNAGMAAADFLPFLGALPAAAKGIRAFHGGAGDVAKAAGDKGAWFSEARGLADEYAFGGGSVREAEITPSKPISFVHAEQRRPIGDLISTALEGAGDLSDEAISRARPIIDRLNAKYAGENKPLFEYWNNDIDVADLFRALGYDSISVAEKSGGPKTWAALNPSIISQPTTGAQ